MQTTRRVRHDVADALLLMGFSLGAGGTSRLRGTVVVAGGLALLTRLP